MQIEIVSTSVEDKGKYQMATITYRKDGKIAEKKLMSFGAGVNAYQKLKAAKAGEIYEVTTVKMIRAFGIGLKQGNLVLLLLNHKQVVLHRLLEIRNETPEERAVRQKLIVRQSSITNAIALFELDKKRVPTVQDVIQVARQFEDYVFGNKVTDEGIGNIAEMDDDVPL